MEQLNEIDQRVGSRIRARRTQLGFTLERLAEALGVSYQQLQKYETGANRVSASRMYALTQILGVRPSCFFDPASVDETSDGPEIDFLLLLENKECRKLNEAFLRIEDPRIRKTIMLLLARLARQIPS